VSSTDVLIAGGGVAGLSAARVLTRAGLRCTIVEARSRIGGRIHTIYDPLSPVPIELGAEFVHGKPPEIWPQIESGVLPAIELVVDGDDETSPILARMAGAPEQSFGEYLEAMEAPEEAKRASAAYVEGFNAARRERISVQSLAEAKAASGRIEGHRLFRLAGGYARLVDWLWSEVASDRREIVLGDPVQSIEWTRGRARVATRYRRFEAPRAIVTLPLGVLKGGDVRIEPDPEILRGARGAIETGSAVRIVLRFRRRLWPENMGFRYAEDPWMSVWWTASPVHAPTITGWLGGPGAEDAAGDPADWVPRTLGSLARMLGIPAGRVAGELESWHAHNWSADPCSRGAYSYVAVGGVAAQKRFGEPVEDTLYFAGEAVDSDGHIGTVHGAMASGTRAANLIVYHSRG
jgi:monoamine oxidase